MNDQPTVSVVIMEERARRNLGRIMLLARWFVAPMYLGMLAGIALLTIKFLQKLIDGAPKILTMDLEDVILLVLSLVDIALVANLVVIVMFASWENFVAPFLRESHDANTSWLGSLGFSNVKRKLMGSILAVAVVQSLETFVHISEVPKDEVMWELAIILGISVAGVLMSAMDRIAPTDEKH